MEMITEPDPVEFVFRDGDVSPRGIFDESTASRVHTRAAILAERDGDSARALTHHERAVEIFRFNFVSGVALVRLHAEDGRVTNARRELQRLEGIRAPSRYLTQARAVLDLNR